MKSAYTRAVLCRSRRRTRSVTPPPGFIGAADSPAHRLLDEIRASGENLGIRKGDGETWREFLARIAEKAAPPPCLIESVTYYYSVRYAGSDPSTDRENELAGGIREWREALAGNG